MTTPEQHDDLDDWRAGLILGRVALDSAHVNRVIIQGLVEHTEALEGRLAALEARVAELERR